MVTRYVSKINIIDSWIKDKFKKCNYKNGSLYLKGGNIDKEISKFPYSIVYPLNNYFEEKFFETKKIIWIPNI